MTPDELIRRYPVLYHMAEDGSWPSIQVKGLLSTTALLDLYGIAGFEREEIERHQRRTKVTLSSPEFGDVVIRDQKPLPASKLATCLGGDMTPSDWYALLNARVFFWLTEDRLETLLRARAYRSEPQTILRVDTAALIERHDEAVELSPINSGSVMPMARPRDRDTFKAVAEYERPRVAELCVSYAVPDIASFVITAERRMQDGSRELLYLSGDETYRRRASG